MCFHLRKAQYHHSTYDKNNTTKVGILFPCEKDCWAITILLTSWTNLFAFVYVKNVKLPTTLPSMFQMWDNYSKLDCSFGYQNIFCQTAYFLRLVYVWKCHSIFYLVRYLIIAISVELVVFFMGFDPTDFQPGRPMHYFCLSSPDLTIQFY